MYRVIFFGMKLFTLTLFFIFLFQMAFTKTLKLGVVGYSREIFDPKEAQEAIKKLIPKMIEIHKPNHVELVSGLTNQGIPKLSYQFAVSKNFKTVGIAPEAAFRVPAGIFPVNKRIIVGKEFGDESETFIDYIDVLIRFGGGPQSRKEVEMFKKKLNHRNLERFLLEMELKVYSHK
jgi:hypothetical protein